jgi:hypothetical protein
MVENKPSNSKLERIIDPDDYDLTLDIHDHHIRHPPIPYHYKDDNEEFKVILDAYYAGFMKKDGKGDYTEYWQAWNAYKKTIKYKREITAHKRYNERLAHLRKKGVTDTNAYLEALLAWNKERISQEK